MLSTAAVQVEVVIIQRAQLTQEAVASMAAAAAVMAAV
jgi:hypothetical protein